MGSSFLLYNIKSLLDFLNYLGFRGNVGLGFGLNVGMVIGTTSDFIVLFTKKNFK